MVTKLCDEHRMKRLFNILFASLLLLQTACQRVELLVEPEIGQNPSGPEFIAQVKDFSPSN
jgi:hypothetical protein